MTFDELIGLSKLAAFSYLCVGGAAYVAATYGAKHTLLDTFVFIFFWPIILWRVLQEEQK